MSLRQVDVRRINPGKISEANVLHDSDHLEIRQMPAEIHIERQIFAKRIFVWPELPRRGFADHGNVRVRRSFLGGEKAPAQQRNAEQLEIVVGSKGESASL
jgi:hypothetical protein